MWRRNDHSGERMVLLRQQSIQSFQINSLLKRMFVPLLGELFCGGKNKKDKNDHKSFLRKNWFEISDLFSTLLIFTIIKTNLSTFVSRFYKNLVKWALTEVENHRETGNIWYTRRRKTSTSTTQYMLDITIRSCGTVALYGPCFLFLIQQVLF
jgi:hypothetical protein